MVTGVLELRNDFQLSGIHGTGKQQEKPRFKVLKWFESSEGVASRSEGGTHAMFVVGKVLGIPPG